MSDQPRDPAVPSLKPTPLPLRCGHCNAWHVDKGEWATRPHRTHLCETCGKEWTPYQFYTFGIQPTSEVMTLDERIRATMDNEALTSVINMQIRSPGERQAPSLAKQAEEMFAERDEALADVRYFRRAFAYAYDGAGLYTDDGELQDNSRLPMIDFKRDSRAEISRKLAERAAGPLVDRNEVVAALRRLVRLSDIGRESAGKVTDDMLTAWDRAWEEARRVIAARDASVAALQNLGKAP